MVTIKRAIILSVSIALLLTMMACVPEDTKPEQLDETEPVSSVLTWQEQYDLGLRFLSEGNYQEAIIAFTAAIEIDPKQVLAYVGRADAYMRLDVPELENAEKDYLAAVDLDEKCTQAYLGLAEIYIAQNEFDKAREILIRGLELTGDPRMQDRIDEIDSGNITDYRGQTRKMSRYDENGELVFYHVYDYEGQHQKSVTVYNAQGVQTDYWDDFLYDEDGFELRSFGYSAEDGSIVVYVDHTYGENGKITESHQHDLDGGDNGYNRFEYDENGNCTRHYLYTAGGELCYYSELIYDTSGKVQKQIEYDSDGTVWEYYEYSYNEDGGISKMVSYDAEGNVQFSQTYD